MLIVRRTASPPLVLLALFHVTTPATATESRPADPDAIVGTWELRNEESCARIRIVRTGDVYEGRIAWLGKPCYPLDDPRGMPGLPRVDRNNPDELLRDRPLVGLTVLSGFEYDGDGRWNSGRVYAPDCGKTYRCRLTLADPWKLEVRGYVKILFAKIGRTMTWHRVPPSSLQARLPDVRPH